MELYSHVPVMRNVLDQLKVFVVECLDTVFGNYPRSGLFCLFQTKNFCEYCDSGTTSCNVGVFSPTLQSEPSDPPPPSPFPYQICMKHSQSWNYNVCAVFLLDATFITDPAKFVSGALLSLSAMVQLELPHLNVLTKCDLADRSEVRLTPR